MLPAIIAAVLMAFTIKRQQPQATPKPVVKPLPVPPSPEPPAPPPVAKPVYRSQTTAAYQAGLRRPVFDAAAERPEAMVAKLFMDKYLQQTHVQHVDNFDPRSTTADDVMAYQKRYSTPSGNRLWQVCAIMTKYGHVYLSVMLNDYGVLSPEALGVLVSYDDDSLEHFILGTAAKQIERFGRVVFATNKNMYQTDTVIRDEDMLRFLLGDQQHPFSVSTYFHE